MQRVIKNAFVTGLIAIASLMSHCAVHAGDPDLDDFSAPYLQRIDTISAGAGDAKQINAVTHMVDPWPRYVRDRRIPANGERMTGAVERYRDVRKLPLTPPPIAPVSIGTSGLSTGTSTTAAPAGTPAAK